MCKVNRCDKFGCWVTEIIFILLCKEFFLMSFVSSVTAVKSVFCATQQLAKVRPCKFCSHNVSLFAASSVQPYIKRPSLNTSAMSPSTTLYKQTRALLWEDALTRCNKCQASDRCALLTEMKCPRLSLQYPSNYKMAPLWMCPLRISSQFTVLYLLLFPYVVFRKLTHCGRLLLHRRLMGLFIYLFCRLYNVSTSSCSHLTIIQGVFQKELYKFESV
jgi:hypothetical protein